MHLTSMAPRREFSRAERLALIALAMIVIQLVIRGWATSGSWFYSDDFIFLGDVGRGEADFGWLFHPHNIHFMPVGLLLAKIVGSLGTFSWFLAAAEILILQAIASVLCWWMLRTLFGDRKGVLVALGFYLFGTLSFPTVLWWAASLNQLPHQIAIFGAIGAHTLYVRHRHPSALVISTLFLTLGLASYSKSLLIPLVIFTLTICYFTEGRFFARLKQTLVQFWPAWLSYGTLVIGYLIMYVLHMPKTQAPRLSDALGTLNLSITDSFASAAIGGPWHWQSLGLAGGIGPRLFVATPAFFVMLSWLLIAALWAYQALKFRRAWVPILILGPYLVLSGVLIATGRAGPFGVGPAALELRYLADLAGIAALCLALAIMPVAGASQGLEPRRPALLNYTSPAWIGKAIMAVFLIGALASSITYARPWHSAREMPQQQYIANAHADLAKGGYQIADIGVPESVLWSVAYPANLTSHVLSPLKRKFKAVKVGTDLKLITATGHLAPAMIDTDPRNLPGPAKSCGYPVRDAARAIPMTQIVDFPFWMSINYLAGEDTTVTVTAGTNTVEAPIKKGVHTLFLQTVGAYDSVTITPTTATGLCVDSIRVGTFSVQKPQ